MKATKENINNLIKNGDKGKNLPERIKLLRRILSMTQSQFAEYIGQSQSQVCALEQGYRKPSSKKIQQIAKRCRCNPIWLQEGIEEIDLLKAETNLNKKNSTEKIIKIASVLSEESLYYLEKQAELILEIQMEKNKKEQETPDFPIPDNGEDDTEDNETTENTEE